MKKKAVHGHVLWSSGIIHIEFTSLTTQCKKWEGDKGKNKKEIKRKTEQNKNVNYYAMPKCFHLFIHYILRIFLCCLSVFLLKHETSFHAHTAFLHKLNISLCVHLM